jgi:hypothetical protein
MKLPFLHLRPGMGPLLVAHLRQRMAESYLISAQDVLNIELHGTSMYAIRICGVVTYLLARCTCKSEAEYFIVAEVGK